MYVNEFWEDPALSYDFMRPCKGNLSFDYKMQDIIWIPNTCFINSKRAQIHSSPFRNVFLMVFPNGKNTLYYIFQGPFIREKEGDLLVCDLNQFFLIFVVFMHKFFYII